MPIRLTPQQRCERWQGYNAARADMAEGLVKDLKKYIEDNRKAVPEQYGWDFEIMMTGFITIIRAAAGGKDD